jgi:hypothetical protein
MTDAAFPFQVEAGLLCASKRLYGLHDEMGVGKTPAVICRWQWTCCMVQRAGS